MRVELNHDPDETITLADLAERTKDDYTYGEVATDITTDLECGVDFVVNWIDEDGMEQTRTYTETDLAEVLCYQFCTWATDDDGTSVLLCWD